MGTALAIAGWLAFGAAAAAGVLVHHSLAARSEAVARACHEVRGSLTAARLGLEWRSRQRPEPRLRAIELELDRAAAALDDLQDVDRALGQPGELADVQAWLNDSVEAFRPLAETLGIDLSVDCNTPLGRVRGRRPRLAQASDNLIANAIEHGGSSILVRGQVRAGMVVIEVADDGPGLTPDLLRVLDGNGGERPLRPWARPRRGRRGHGLMIARDVAAGHGGRLTAVPNAEGARLVLELPLAE
jgi:signal transduction histidine kinase